MRHSIIHPLILLLLLVPKLGLSSEICPQGAECYEVKATAGSISHISRSSDNFAPKTTDSKSDKCKQTPTELQLVDEDGNLVRHGEVTLYLSDGVTIHGVADENALITLIGIPCGVTVSLYPRLDDTTSPRTSRPSSLRFIISMFFLFIFFVDLILQWRWKDIVFNYGATIFDQSCPILPEKWSFTLQEWQGMTDRGFFFPIYKFHRYGENELLLRIRHFNLFRIQFPPVMVGKLTFDQLTHTVRLRGRLTWGALAVLGFLLSGFGLFGLLFMVFLIAIPYLIQRSDFRHILKKIREA